MIAVFRLSALLLALTVLASALPLGSARAADPLPAMQLQPGSTTVSGLSSGAYMAVQLHIANSQSIAGAGVVAGGPYRCAEGSVIIALNRCMDTAMGEPDAEALLRQTQALAAAGHIDSLDGLAGDRLYLFSGSEDETVTRPVMDAALAFYREAGVPEPNIAYVTDIAAGHGFLVEDAENACRVSETPFINDCDYDQARAILNQFYGPLEPAITADESRLMAFDQAEFLPDPQSHGMAESGFVYVPEICVEGAPGQPCRLHIAFAGCRQTPADIGDLYPRITGYNRWAESNRLVILYPQSSVSPDNPLGCWDWWGYDDPDHLIKRGRQMAAVASMAERLGVPFAAAEAPAFCEKHESRNWLHWANGRAELCGWVALCAVGSGEPLGYAYGAATLYESPQGNFLTTACGS